MGVSDWFGPMVVDQEEWNGLRVSIIQIEDVQYNNEEEWNGLKTVIIQIGERVD